MTTTTAKRKAPAKKKAPARKKAPIKAKAKAKAAPKRKAPAKKAPAKKAVTAVKHPAAHVHFQYRPQGPVMREFHKRDDFVRVLIGPLGSGKTQGCISEMLRQIDDQTPDAYGVRRSRWVAARNTYPDLLNTTIKDFREITDTMDIGRFVMSSPPRWRAKYAKRDGTLVDAEVLFLAFDIPADEKKARGLQLSGCWLNEFKELTRNNSDMLMGRVGRYPPRTQVRNAKSCVIADTNAPDRDHWLAKLAKDEKPEGWWFGIQPAGVVRQGGEWVTNPNGENIRNLPDGYYKRLVAGRPESWIRKNLANEFVFHADGRPVHPAFNESLHVSPYELLPTFGMPLDVGIDFGRTPAAAIMQRQPSGQWYVLDELVTVNTNALEFGRSLRRFMNEKYDGFEVTFTGDPAGDQMAQTRDETPLDMLAAAGVECYPAYTNDFEERITVLDQQLTNLVDGQPSFYISPHCTTLIKGLAGAYQFKRIQVSGQERFHDKPVKDDTSHVCEAVHYGLLGAGEGVSLFNTAWQQEFGDVERWAPDPGVFE